MPREFTAIAKLGALLLGMAFATFPATHVAEADDGSLNGRSVSELTDLYVKLAFGSEFMPPQDGSQFRILKRDQTEPVNIIPLPKPSVPLRASFDLVRNVAKMVEAKSGGLVFHVYDELELASFLKKNQAKEKNDPNSDWPNSILVYFGSREELRAPMQAVGVANPALLKLFDLATTVDHPTPFCMAAGERAPGKKYTLGFTIIWIEYGQSAPGCVFEELMQSFGIGQDFPAGTPSIFNDDNVYSRPTDLDWRLWRIHTDSRIRPGMTKAQVRRQLPKILN